MKQNIMRIMKMNLPSNLDKLILGINPQENKSPPAMIKSLRSLIALCLITLSSMTLVACGGSSGGGGGGGGTPPPKNKAPTVVANSAGAPITTTEDTTDIVFNVTATKVKNDTTNNVTFPTTIRSAAPECVAMIASATGDSVEESYAVNATGAIGPGSAASVQYTISARSAIACGEFTFRATEADLTGEVTLAGVVFIVFVPVDTDEDGVDDFTADGTPVDNCRLISNADQANVLGSETSKGDACDDEDGDGIVDLGDNCVADANPGQSDLNGDGEGDFCDTDSDSDGDTTNDASDVDADGDGLIELSTVTQLNAVRYNLNGTGLDLNDEGSNSDGGDATGCPTTGVGCTGYELMANLTLAATTSWTPIGQCTDNNCNAGEFFAVTFEGNGNSITDISITTNETLFGVGFFGATSAAATIHDLHLRNVNISAANSQVVGGLVGGARGLINASSIEARNILGGRSIGGLVGVLYGGEVLSSLARMQRMNGIFSVPIGGLIGFVLGGTRVSSSLAVVNSINGEGAIISEIPIVDGGFFALASTGGLVGYSIGTITSSAALVHSINGFNRNTGGLVGNVGVGNPSTTSIAALAVAHTISSSALSGGLFGGAFNANIDYNLALTKSIRGSGGVGGLLGASSDGLVLVPANPNRVTASYWDDSVSLSGPAQPTVTGSSAQPTSVLQDSDNAIYATWAKGLGSGADADANAGWCDPATGVYSGEDDAPTGYDPVWDLEDGEYPALSCLPLSVTEQRELITKILNNDLPVPVTGNN